MTTTIKTNSRAAARVARDKYVPAAELQKILQEEITSHLKENSPEKPAEFDADFLHKPHVILVVGVNGVGKTTTIGKIAHLYKSTGKQVVLGEADNFQAAAEDEMTSCGE